MAHFLDDVIVAIYDAERNLDITFGNFRYYLDTAAGYFMTGDYYNGGVYLDDAAGQIFYIRKYLHNTSISISQQTRLGLTLIRDNWPEDGFELTWQAICEAWVKNDFEGMEWTIAVIDRMRSLMWDKPFKIQWAASPTSENG